MTYDFKKIVLRRIVLPGPTASGLRRWWAQRDFSLHERTHTGGETGGETLDRKKTQFIIWSN
jgi:hypothetical protein